MANASIPSILLEALSPANGKTPFRSIFENQGVILGTLAGPEKENEDRLAVIDYRSVNPSDSFIAFVVADGVGGLTKGGQCAELAIAGLVQCMICSRERDAGSRLAKAVLKANDVVYSKFRGESATTLSALAIFANSRRVYFSSVGDSRIYRYLEAESPARFDQVTEDDTIGNQVARVKGKTPAESAEQGIMGQLTQAIGSEPEIDPKVRADTHISSVRFLLATDGLYSAGRDNLFRVLSSSPSPRQMLERSSHLAKWLGTRDDVSGIYVASTPVFDSSAENRPTNSVLRIHTTSITWICIDPEKSLCLVDDGDGGEKPVKQKRKKTASKKPRRQKPKSGASKDGADKNSDSAAEEPTGSASENSEKEEVGQRELEINYIKED